MTLRRYTGYSPSNVNKDAKYSTTADGKVRLVYRVSNNERWLLSTDDHDDLVAMVDAVKVELTGQRGGAFYINEFGDVLVPDGQGGSCYWAGHYDDVLEFVYEDQVVSSVTPAGLAPGDVWPGPHVGIRYALKAGGRDIKFENKDGARITIEVLSDHVGGSRAGALAERLARTVGSSGGRIYINERSEFFSPASPTGGPDFIYLGSLDEDAWFPPPAGFERP